MMHVSFRNNK